MSPVSSTAPPAPNTFAGECSWQLDGGKLVDTSGPSDVESRATSFDLCSDQPFNLRGVDVDGDPHRDYIASLGGCGDWGDCLFVVLQACGAQRYRAVWGPEYAQSVDIGGREPGRPLADLLLGGRTATAGCDLPLRTELVWSPTGWRERETCAPGAGGDWSAACGDRPPTCARPGTSDSPRRGEEPVALFVVYGSQLIPAICKIGDRMASGDACESLLGNEINVRLSNGRVSTGRSSLLECCPTGEVTVAYDLGGPTDAVFAVTPATEASARLDRQAVSGDVLEGTEGNEGFMHGDGGVTESLATSDLDGDHVREAIVRHDYGHGRILSVLRLAPERKTDLLFHWECGS